MEIIMMLSKKTVSKFVLTAMLVGTVPLVVGAPERLEDVSISELRTYDNYAIAVIDPPISNTQNCGNINEDSFVAIEWGVNADFKTLYAATLAAFMTDKQVTFAINGCSSRFGQSGNKIPRGYRLDVLQD
jgi:hypothetical protein